MLTIVILGDAIISIIYINDINKQLLSKIC